MMSCKLNRHKIYMFLPLKTEESAACLCWLSVKTSERRNMLSDGRWSRESASDRIKPTRSGSVSRHSLTHLLTVLSSHNSPFPCPLKVTATQASFAYNDRISKTELVCPMPRETMSGERRTENRAKRRAGERRREQLRRNNGDRGPGKGADPTRGCHDNYRHQSPQRQSGSLFLGATYCSVRATVNTLFLSSPDAIVTTNATMETLMRTACNCSLLIKSHSSHYTRTQWASSLAPD